MHVLGRFIDLLKPAIFGLACSFVFRMASRISLGPPGCRSSFSRKDGGADLEHARCALGINFGVYPHYGDVCDIYLFAPSLKTWKGIERKGGFMAARGIPPF